MPIHDWTRVKAGKFHDFHQAWNIELRSVLNGLRLHPYRARRLCCRRLSTDARTAGHHAARPHNRERHISRIERTRWRGSVMRG